VIFFSIFQIKAAAIVDCENRAILLADKVQGPRCIIVQKWVKIGQSVAEIMRFFDFLRWRSSAMLDLFRAHFDSQCRVYTGRSLLYCAINEVHVVLII